MYVSPQDHLANEFLLVYLYYPKTIGNSDYGILIVQRTDSKKYFPIAITIFTYTIHVLSSRSLVRMYTCKLHGVSLVYIPDMVTSKLCTIVSLYKHFGCKS